MHLYQAAMAGKFEGRDKSLLLSEPLAQALTRLVEAIIASARTTHNETMVDSMLAGLKFSKDYPQYELIIEAFTTHHAAMNWIDLSSDTKLAYLVTAIKPLEVNQVLLNSMIDSIDRGIK